MMNHEQRMEILQIIRGLLQVAGIIIIIACTIALYKVRAQGHECKYVTPEREEQSTGLYGNCTFIQDRLNRVSDDGNTIPWEQNISLGRQ